MYTLSAEEISRMKETTSAINSSLASIPTSPIIIDKMPTGNFRYYSPDTRYVPYK